MNTPPPHPAWLAVISLKKGIQNSFPSFYRFQQLLRGSDTQREAAPPTTSPLVTVHPNRRPSTSLHFLSHLHAFCFISHLRRADGCSAPHGRHSGDEGSSSRRKRLPICRSEPQLLLIITSSFIARRQQRLPVTPPPPNLQTPQRCDSSHLADDYENS